MKNMVKGKVLILGIDGMDPGLTQKFLNEHKLPHIQQYLERGAAHTDLSMLGGVPTITPPMWTTLSTGATPATHGITCFWAQNLDKLDTIMYNLDSSNCQAEPLWNVAAANSRKTLVWHWPGSSWPPTSDSPYLHVVDGTQPQIVNTGIATVDEDKLVYAATAIDEVRYKPNQATDTGAGCIIKHLDEDSDSFDMDQLMKPSKNIVNIELSIYDGEAGAELGKMDAVNSPMRPAEGWSAVLPEGSREFTIITSSGYTKRFGIISPDNDGIYRQAAIYKNKKALKPLTVLTPHQVAGNVQDDVLSGEQTVAAHRPYCLLDIAPDGSSVTLWLGPAMADEDDRMFHPTSLYRQVMDHVGLIPPTSTNGAIGKSETFIENFLLETWRQHNQWQADSLNYLIQANQYELVFSHLHNIDILGHMFWPLAKEGNHEGTNACKYQGYIEQAYIDTDYYLGQFLPLLDDGWTIFIVSDHGLLIRNHEYPCLGDPFGVNAKIMSDLGYTVLKKDADGQLLKEIDWAHTKAVASRGNHIWINLQGRQSTGIVAPEEQYDLEEQIISDLYAYRDESGKRVVSVVMRNKEAAIVGMTGPRCGDLIYWLSEGCNRVHGDSLPTYQGYMSSSVSPIFIAAGPGIKPGITERTIRQIDVAPTAAVIAHLPMPAQCEGAPIYQILETLPY